MCHRYYFGELNRLEKAWDHAGREAMYFYNGLGQRTGREDGGTQETYLLDVTKTYNNLLGVVSSGKTQNFYWDYNVAAVEEQKMLRYYLQDELGSPLRVLYSTGKGDSYGYEEFGIPLQQSQNGNSFGNWYSYQGESQPFGYTGYRYDKISGTYFAQAREFKPELGRFVSEDG